MVPSTELCPERRPRPGRFLLSKGRRVIFIGDTLHQLERYLSDAMLEQLPFAASQALNDTGRDVAEAWVLTVQTVGDRQELQLRAHDPEPSVWPLRLELIDDEGNVISTGYRRGTTTLDNTLATQWRFSQPTLTPEPAAGSEAETQDQSENEPAPTWRLRIHHATGLGSKQLDAVLGEVQLIDLTAPADAEADPSPATD